MALISHVVDQHWLLHGMCCKPLLTLEAADDELLISVNPVAVAVRLLRHSERASAHGHVGIESWRSHVDGMLSAWTVSMPSLEKFLKDVSATLSQHAGKSPLVSAKP